MKLLDEYVDYHKGFTACPETFVRWSGLYALSTIAGWGHVYKTGNWNFRPNLWVLLCGESSAKKSTALITTKHLLKEIKEEYLAKTYYSHASFIVDMSKNPHRCFIYNEADTSFRMLDETHNKPLRSEMMSLFDGFPCSKEIRGTEGKGDFYATELVPGINGYIGPYRGPYLCWAAATTFAQVNDHLQGNTSHIESGFFPRMLLVPQLEQTQIIPRPKPHDQAKYDSILAKLKDLFMEPDREYVYSESAGKIFDEWYYRIHARIKTKESIFTPFYLKMCEIHAHKIAILSAFERGNATMDDHDIEFAIQMLWPIEKSWPTILGKFTETKKQKIESRVYSYITEHPGCTISEIQRVLRLPGDELSKLIYYAKENNILDIELKKTGGRHAKCLTLR